MTTRKYAVKASVRSARALGTFTDQEFEVSMEEATPDKLASMAIEILGKRGFEVNHVASISYETAGAQ